ncbi:23S rRNA (guanosine(2251)-2'-O)-methyltransferase RlmB [Pseudidiomarina terrestris]|uniref:23S rRNA (guanosine-2'-O-)-methyltransferase RlmB n=1 Tax=Pseudidiomarina terrestris TaxID=2820060 RepID=A0ABT8MK53_9GAMM|nr:MULTISPECIES: 23S rRNA (guanosine(2251)-2'-O)-methyltransferase RlmB [unclassified Pseudidiomarina]MDN7130331.1 23S rRNA (guanosine(2251)-2'-O)-methyltransferase RlmB [Pseudidiomarina sp. 1APR75-15]MDN7136254.1 23S rRNA (guanosine(2251)-2'-O)-methyltransferase RlmB [Pseudidiomarina sp. 1ASP75-5]MDN7138829.1 23S rRNA (guanosine(2251)-2'-O)-methyltransferase RlmB [Pseudidiomarina sp. 1ASP75-14]
MSKKVSVFGLHAVRALLERHPERVIEIFALRERQDQALQSLVQSAQKMGIRPQFVPKHTLEKKAEGGNHQGVVVTAQEAPLLSDNDLPDLVEKSAGKALFLVLDGITDPHNLGACLRTADAAGVTAVIVPKDKSASLNPTVRKVASGAAETVPLVQVTNLARALKQLQDLQVWVMGTAGEAEQSVYAVDLKNSVAVVMGAEGDGMRRLTRETCDELIKIPLQGTVSSLNVSVATGVCLFEAVRQRQGN